MNRFVLLWHECPPALGKSSHWDLMLECDGALRTWSLERLPDVWGRTLDLSPAASGELPLAAVRLADHRLAYLDYEGPVSGGRGEVTRCDRGEYGVAAESADRMVVELFGGAVRGSWALARESGEVWRLSAASLP